MKNLLVRIFLLLILFGCQGTTEKQSKKLIDVSKNEEIETLEFNPYGYYIPTTSVNLKTTQFEWIYIDYHEGDNINSALNIEIRLRELKSDKIFTIKVNNLKISKDSLCLIVEDSTTGKFTINNKFTGKFGPINDKITEAKSIVQTGILRTADFEYKLKYIWTIGD